MECSVECLEFRHAPNTSIASSQAEIEKSIIAELMRETFSVDVRAVSGIFSRWCDMFRKQRLCRDVDRSIIDFN